MNTNTQNLLTALTATLLAPPFVIKLNDDRVNTLQSVIASVLPSDKLDSKLVDNFRKAIAEKSAKVDDFNLQLIHVGDSQKIEKTGSQQSDGDLLLAHDVTLAINLTNDTLRLATYIIQSFKYAESDRVKQSDKLRARHANRELLAALQLIDGLATIEDVRSTKPTNSAETTPLTASELAELGITSDRIHSAIWCKYGKSRESRLIKIIFKAKDDNVKAKQAINRLLAKFPAFDDAGNVISASKSASEDYLNCIVGYCDLTSTEEEESFF